MRTGALVYCACCGKLGKLRSRGLISSCYESARRLGLLEEVALPTSWKSRHREKCGVPHCCLVVFGRGLCKPHYDQWRRLRRTCNPWRQRDRLESCPMPIMQLLRLILQFDNLLLESMIHGELSRSTIERASRCGSDDTNEDEGCG